VAGLPSGKKNSIPVSERKTCAAPGSIPVGVEVGEDEGLRIGAALEPDPGQAAYGAVPAVAAGHEAGGHDLLAAVAVAQRGRGGVPGVAQADQFNATLHADAGRRQMLAEDTFGLGLGQEQQERVGGVLQAEVEHRHRQHPAGDVHAQLHSPVSAGDQLVGDTQPGQNLQGARLDRQRAGLVRPVQATVDEAGPDTECGQLRSQCQPSRSGAHHKHVDQPAGHDATLRLAADVGATARPSGTACPRLHHLERARLIAGSRSKADGRRRPRGSKPKGAPTRLTCIRR
jgi:hypothetical protein